MTRQLVLITTSGADWRLDDDTRDRGRRGVAEAREILRRAIEADEAVERDARRTRHAGRQHVRGVSKPAA